ncbi:hypothetical protein Sj15T_00480 [Sphingobium sp. TA15]|nr:hypothetical protein Sj15T_00480 [Sphingobium sp. TA15]
MKRLLALASAMSLAAVSNQAQAQWLTGNQLYEWCSSTSVTEGGACMAYVIGALDGNLSINTANGVTRGQIKDVVRKYLADHPERRQMMAATLVYMAVYSAWPQLNKMGK